MFLLQTVFGRPRGRIATCPEGNHELIPLLVGHELFEIGALLVANNIDHVFPEPFLVYLPDVGIEPPARRPLNRSLLLGAARDEGKAKGRKKKGYQKIVSGRVKDMAARLQGDPDMLSQG